MPLSGINENGLPTLRHAIGLVLMTTRSAPANLHFAGLSIHDDREHCLPVTVLGMIIRVPTKRLRVAVVITQGHLEIKGRQGPAHLKQAIDTTQTRPRLNQFVKLLIDTSEFRMKTVIGVS